jgi:hypothetical protein
MKKLLLSMLLAGTSLVTFAQLPTFGIKGGANFAKFHASIDGLGGSGSSGSLTTFNIGAFVDFKFGNVSLQPALNFTGKGGTSSTAIDDESTSSGKVRLYYLQVPVNLVYHVPAVVGDLYFGAGPYIAMGISGKAKDDDGNSGDIKFGSGADDLKRTDAGLNAIVGFKFKTGFLINANYDWGLTNVTNLSGVKLTNRVFGVSIGYAF